MSSRSQLTVTAIFAAAEALFVEKSYADVTMEHIAQEARLTKGALYHHFESKEELYLAMMLADLEGKRCLLAQAAASDGTCRERLRRLTRAFLMLPATKQRLIRLVRRDANVFRNPSRENLIRAYQRALPDVIENILDDGIRDGDLAPADPKLLAWHYAALVEVMLSRYAEARVSHIDARLDYVLDFFFHGAAMTTPKEVLK